MHPLFEGYGERASDLETAQILPGRHQKGRWRSPRPLVLARTFFIFLATLVACRCLHAPQVKIFSFDDDPRPSWLDVRASKPTRIRVAVVSRPGEFHTRDALRKSVFRGLRRSDVEVEFRFFVGAPSGLFSSWTTSRLEEEVNEHGDVVYLEKITDMNKSLSQKRFEALKWGGSVSRTEYDWFMTIDSDTFVRFGALSKRLSVLLKDKISSLQNQSVLVGRMGTHHTYWENTVPSRASDGSCCVEDSVLRGPWFDYPIGVGYMLSPFLVETLLSLDPPPPHHIHYPSDDVMIGSWVAALKHFPDKNAHFETTREHSPAPIRKVDPRPYLPASIDTIIIDDKEGWHDYAGRKGGYDAPFSWDSVCLHHVYAGEMRILRDVAEINNAQ